MSDDNKILFVILSYKRSKALSECIRTLFNNTKIHPTLTYILDDNSDYNHKSNLLNFSQEYSDKIGPINVLFNGQNRGIGNQIETAFRIAQQINPTLFFLIEGDYFWRNEYLEDVVDGFNLCPHTWGCCGCHHNDMLLEYKYYGEFAKLMEIYFGRDIEYRKYYYKPFKVRTPRGEMELLPCTNTCGCQILHFQKINNGIKDLGMEKEFWRSIYNSFHEKGDRSVASDGRLSCTITWFFELWAKKNNIDLTRNFAYITPITSIGFHACNGGKNGLLNPNIFLECGDFPGVNSGTFPKNYNAWKRQ